MAQTFNIIINAKQLAYLGIVVKEEMNRGNIAQDGEVSVLIHPDVLNIYNQEGNLLFASAEILPKVEAVKEDTYFDPTDPDQLLREG